MNKEDFEFYRAFFAAASYDPLDADDPRYVPVYDAPERRIDDPVAKLATAIAFSPDESVQLFSGFRGAGKSTELRRLRQQLKQAGYCFVLCDSKKIFNISTPVDVSDFLLGLAGAFGDELVAQGYLGQGAVEHGYWARFIEFLRETQVELPEIAPLGVKINLKDDPSFKELLQQRLAGHLAAFTRDVHAYMGELVARVRRKHGEATQVVLCLDHVEHIRGSYVNATRVQESVETLFSGHADKLHIPGLHVVYTVPPYLTARYANIGTLYAPGGLHILPVLRVRAADGAPDTAGLDLMERIVRKRGDWQRLLGSRETLDRIALMSGGHLRDLMGLLREVLRLPSDVLPVSSEIVQAAIHNVREGFLPISNADALWLERIAETHRSELESNEHVPDLARFLDTRMVLCFRNGRLWYDVHPLIRDEVRALGRRLRERGQGAGTAEPAHTSE